MIQNIIELGLSMAPSTPRIEWDISPELQEWSTKAAFVIALIWLFFLLMQFVLPSKRGGGGLGRGGGAKFLGAAVVIIILLDLNMIPHIINNFISIIEWIATVLGLG